MPGGTCGLFPSLVKQREEQEAAQRGEKEILALAVKTWGDDAQSKMVLEEMAELQKEICKNWRGKENRDQIADEIADVEIMLAQLKMIHGIEELVEVHRKMKLARLAERLEVR